MIDFHNIKLLKDNEEFLEGETFHSEARQIFIDALHQEEKEYNNKVFYLELEECLLNLPPLNVMDNPITI